MSTHEKSIVVDAPVHEVFSMWSSFDNFPEFMSHVDDVTILEADRSHWRGTVGGVDEEWDARTTRMEEDRAIGWESTSGFKNKGEILFDPVDSGTKITVHLEYDPPAGVLGDVVDVAYISSKFDRSLEEDLSNFKKSIENS